MRAVLDPNVLVSALLSRDGRPAALVGAWLAAAFELVVSEKLLGELQRALAYPKIRARVPDEEASAFLALLRASAVVVQDPEAVEPRSVDPDDDYLLALAEAGTAYLVTGDRDLLDLAGDLPVVSPAGFAALLRRPE